MVWYGTYDLNSFGKKVRSILHYIYQSCEQTQNQKEKWCTIHIAIFLCALVATQPYFEGYARAQRNAWYINSIHVNLEGGEKGGTVRQCTIPKSSQVVYLRDASSRSLSGQGHPSQEAAQDGSLSRMPEEPVIEIRRWTGKSQVDWFSRAYTHPVKKEKISLIIVVFIITTLFFFLPFFFFFFFSLSLFSSSSVSPRFPGWPLAVDPGPPAKQRSRLLPALGNGCSTKLSNGIEYSARYRLPSPL